MRRMNRSIESPEFLRTNEFFELWLSDMDDALEYFIASLPPEVGALLDYSPESLDILEAWILERYPTTKDMQDRYELTRVDDMGRYIGEVFRKHIGGQWEVNLEDPADGYYARPFLSGPEHHPYIQYPMTKATAAADRRRGDYIRAVFEQVKQTTPEYSRKQHEEFQDFTCKIQHRKKPKRL